MTSSQLLAAFTHPLNRLSPQDETDVMVFVISTDPAVNVCPWDWDLFIPAVFNGGDDGNGSIRGLHRIHVVRDDTSSPWRIIGEIIPLLRQF